LFTLVNNNINNNIDANITKNFNLKENSFINLKDKNQINNNKSINEQINEQISEQIDTKMLKELLNNYENYVNIRNNIKNFLYTQETLLSGKSIYNTIDTTQKIVNYLTAISYHETKHKPYTININKIEKKINNEPSSLISLLEGLKIGLKSGKTYIAKYKITLIIYYSDNTKKYKNIIVDLRNKQKQKNTLQKIDNLIKWLQHHNNLKIYVKTKYPLAFTFDDIDTAKKFLMYCYSFTDNIDVGLFQINLKYQKDLIKAKNYDFTDLLEIKPSIDLGSAILLVKLEQTKQILKAVGVFHNNNTKIHKIYISNVNKILKSINYIDKNINKYSKMNNTHSINFNFNNLYLF
jgi:hypothetical protein